MRASGSPPCRAWLWPWAFPAGGSWSASPPRGELERFTAAQGGRVSQLLEWAASWVEEETLQAACRKETASGARFILQTAFGYGERSAPDLGPITVQVEDGEGGEA